MDTAADVVVAVPAGEMSCCPGRCWTPTARELAHCWRRLYISYARTAPWEIISLTSKNVSDPAWVLMMRWLWLGARSDVRRRHAGRRGSGVRVPGAQRSCVERGPCQAPFIRPSGTRGQPPASVVSRESEPLRNHNGTAWGDGLRQLGVQLVGRPHSEYPLIDLAEQLTS